MGFGLEVVTPAVCGLLPLSAVSGDGRPSGRAVCPLDGRCVRFHRSHSGRSPDPQARCCVRRTYRVTSVSHVRESRRVQSLVSANGRSEWSSSEQFWTCFSWSLFEGRERREDLLRGHEHGHCRRLLGGGRRSRWSTDTCWVPPARGDACAALAVGPAQTELGVLQRCPDDAECCSVIRVLLWMLQNLSSICH